MASSSGGVSFHRTGSSSRINTTSVPVEHLHSIQSGVQVDWQDFPPIQPSWVTRNDSAKAHYAGSVANVPFTKKVKHGVGLCDSRKPHVWRAAAVELVVTAGLTFLTITAYNSKASLGALALLQALIYSLAILAAAPTSGGHLNPAITLTTFVTGKASLVRTLLYVGAQLLGGILGAAGVWVLTPPRARTQYSIGGCLVGELPGHGAVMAGEAMSTTQGLLAETVFSIVMLFVVYGIGFDSRSVVATFPILSPFVIGGVFGVLVFVSQGVGYTAATNPARCLGPAVVYWKYLWKPSLYVFTLGPLAAAVVVGIFQRLVHRGNDAEVGGPVLPLNFFQVVTPDNQRPGFGPRCGSVSWPTVEQDIAHSQRLGLSELQRSPSAPRSAGEFNLVLQVKAFMQPKGSEERRASVANTLDVTRFNQNLLLQQYSNSHGSLDSAVNHHSGDPEKDR